MFGVEAAGSGLKTGLHSATLSFGTPGILHGMLTYLLQDSAGQVSTTHSIAAGLDYPAVGPQHAQFKESGRVKYVAVKDKDALNAFITLSRTEGIIPALESAHAVAEGIKIASNMKRSESVVITLSGRGDKDVDLVRGIFS